MSKVDEPHRTLVKVLPSGDLVKYKIPVGFVLTSPHHKPKDGRVKKIEISGFEKSTLQNAKGFVARWISGRPALKKQRVSTLREEEALENQSLYSNDTTTGLFDEGDEPTTATTGGKPVEAGTGEQITKSILQEETPEEPPAKLSTMKLPTATVEASPAPSTPLIPLQNPSQVSTEDDDDDDDLVFVSERKVRKPVTIKREKDLEESLVESIPPVKGPSQDTQSQSQQPQQRPTPPEEQNVPSPYAAPAQQQQSQQPQLHQQPQVQPVEAQVERTTTASLPLAAERTVDAHTNNELETFRETQERLRRQTESRKIKEQIGRAARARARVLWEQQKAGLQRAQELFDSTVAKVLPTPPTQVPVIPPTQNTMAPPTASQAPQPPITHQPDVTIAPPPPEKEPVPLLPNNTTTGHQSQPQFGVFELATPFVMGQNGRGTQTVAQQQLRPAPHHQTQPAQPRHQIPQCVPLERQTLLQQQQQQQQQPHQQLLLQQPQPNGTQTWKAHSASGTSPAIRNTVPTPNTNGPTGFNNFNLKIVRLSSVPYHSDLKYDPVTFERTLPPISANPPQTAQDTRLLMRAWILYLSDTHSVWRTWNNPLFRAILRSLPGISSLDLSSFENIKRVIVEIASTALKNVIVRDFVVDVHAQIHLILRPMAEGCMLLCRSSKGSTFVERCVAFSAQIDGVRSEPLKLLQAFLDSASKNGFANRVKSFTFEDAMECISTTTKSINQGAGKLPLQMNISVLDLFKHAMALLMSNCNVPVMLNGERSLLDALLVSQTNNIPSPQTLLMHCREIFAIIQTDIPSFIDLQRFHPKKNGLPYIDIKDLATELGNGRLAETIRNALACLIDNEDPLTTFSTQSNKISINHQLFSCARIWYHFLDGVLDIHSIMTSNEALGPALYQVQVLDFIVLQMTHLEAHLSGVKVPETLIFKAFIGVYKLYRQDPKFVMASLLLKRAIKSVKNEPVSQTGLQELSTYLTKKNPASTELSRFLGDNLLKKELMPTSDEFKRDYPLLSELVQELMLSSPSVHARKMFLLTGKSEIGFDMTNLEPNVVTAIAIERSFNNPDYLVVAPPNHSTLRYIGMGHVSSSTTPVIPQNNGVPNGSKEVIEIDDD